MVHHVTPELLTAGFFDLKRNACPGVDGVTWHEYRDDLEERIANLHRRIQSGAYRLFPYVFATLYRQLGIDPMTTPIPDRAGRPQFLVDIREPIRELI